MEKTLGIFERYLWLWVFVCMLVGVGFSVYIPSVSIWLDEWKLGNVSVPIWNLFISDDVSSVAKFSNE